MAQPKTGEMSASMAVLCLLVEQPDTVASLSVRLAQQFPDARWQRNAAHNNMSSLVNQGLVRLAKKAPSGKPTSLDSYRATDAGVAEARTWLRESAVVPPVLRDVLQAKLEFSREQEDLLGLIETVREEEDACAKRYAHAHMSDMRAQQERRRSRSRGQRPSFQDGVCDVKLADEAALWGMMSKRLVKLRENLEDLLEEVREAPASGMDRG
ncbi:MAG TPA: hypothetical protein VNV42_02010 [Solirubrobacteraceae bacterium]|jgi:hypothetical protein|nr:hypothetical protein [Solirubrobacteraceae bacterium]